MTKEAKILIAIAVVVVIGGVLLAIFANPQPAEPGAPVDQQSLIRDSSHMTKKSTAKVNIVEFGDYQCPGCGVAHPILKQVVEQYKDNENVNFVFRNYPLESIHPNARIASEAAEAAGAQGKFWEMHDLLYERQNDWNVQPNPLTLFADYANSLGINVDQFKTSINQSSAKDIIQADIDDGTKLGVTGTPTFFVNEEMISGYKGWADIKAVIEKKLNASAQ